MKQEMMARLAIARGKNARNFKELNCFKLFETISEFGRNGLALSGIVTKNELEADYLFYVIFGGLYD